MARRELPPYLSEAWYALHRHLKDGAILGAASTNREDALAWNSAFIREGDEWFRLISKRLNTP